MAALSTADRVAAHVLRQVRGNPRLAYYIGPMSESYELLTQAVAEASGVNVDEFRREIESTLRTQGPDDEEAA